MPFTPFHLGPGLFAAALLFALADLPTFLLASVILDIEPGSVRIFRLLNLTPPYAYHGFLHTFVGATFAALALARFLNWLAAKYRNSRIFGYAWKPTKNAVFLASFIGIYLHVFADSFVNVDMRPFWPYPENPLLGLVPPLAIYLACFLLFVAGALLYYARLIRASGSPFLKPAVPK